MRLLLNITEAVSCFAAIVMLMAAAGMMDQGAEILVCVKLVVCSILLMVAGAGFSAWRRI